jgi:hypothetical protein
MKIIIYILIILCFTSCVTESNFKKFHLKDEPKSAANCAAWYPVKEKLVVGPVTYKEGEPILLPSETQFVIIDCDSVAKSKSKVKKVYVRIPAPIRVDTIFKPTTYYVENTAYRVVLEDSIGKLQKDNGDKEKELTSVRSTRNKLWGTLIVLVVLGAGTWWIKNARVV